MRVSMVVYDLPFNPIVRAAPIALALAKIGFEIEVVGVLKPGATVYAPYLNAFEYKTATTHWKLPGLITGDIIYACKPMPSTILPAMRATNYARDKPVLLDIEDDNFGVCGKSRMIRCMKAVRDAVKTGDGYLYPTSHAMRFRCDAVTVSSTVLQRFYGGTKLLHGPDEKLFDPHRSDLDSKSSRAAFGLPADELLVLFAGRPQKHKGIEEIVDAVEKTGCSLVLAGPPDDPSFVESKARLGEKCFLIGMVDNHQMPTLLAAIDIVPVPQHDVPFARAQLPAKLIEAMAMGKSVIVSDVGDLAAIVDASGSESRGWVIQPGAARELADAIIEIRDTPQLVAERSRNARSFYEQHASVSANCCVLQSVFESTPRLRTYLERV